MKIFDPRTTDLIDVTGWDLDRLRDTLAVLHFDALHGSDRELDDEEIEDLAGEYGLGDDPLAEPGGWHLHDDEVQEAIIRLWEIVTEAIYQRDLPGALGAKAAGRGLTDPQRAAWEVYSRELSARYVP